MNNKILKIILFFCLSLSITGCRLDYEADVEVREDGSVKRTTVYHSVNRKDELLESYDLLDGGRWEEYEEEGERIKSKVAIYTLKQEFASLKSPKSDYKRFNEDKSRWAHNEFKLAYRNWWFIKFYKYQEEYFDVINHVNIIKIVDEIFDVWMSRIEEQLDAKIEDKKLISQIVLFVDKEYRPKVHHMALMIKEQGFNYFSDTLVEKQIEEEFSGEYLANLIIKEVPEASEDISYEDLVISLEESEITDGDQWEEYEEEIFGIHGFTLFENYDFLVRLNMPGKLISSNAEEIDGDTLVWEFDNTSLRRKLWAKSFKVYPERIVIIIVISLIMLMIGRRKFKKSEDV